MGHSESGRKATDSDHANFGGEIRQTAHCAEPLGAAW